MLSIFFDFHRNLRDSPNTFFAEHTRQSASGNVKRLNSAYEGQSFAFPYVFLYKTLGKIRLRILLEKTAKKVCQQNLDFFLPFNLYVQHRFLCFYLGIGVRWAFFEVWEQIYRKYRHIHVYKEPIHGSLMMAFSSVLDPAFYKILTLGQSGTQPS